MTLHSKGRKHSKKRNTGLIHEFLTRHVMNSVITGDTSDADKVIAVIQRNFASNTQLYREWRLFNALVKTSGVDETMANAIIRETRDAVRRYDRVRLDREKSGLIKEINHTFGKDVVYSHSIPNYTLHATIQTLFNDWRDTGLPNISRIADYERKLQRHLMRAPDNTLAEVVKDDHDPVVEALAVKLMVESFNQRYAKKLGPQQRILLDLYVFEDDVTKLRESMLDIRRDTLNLLDQYSKVLKEKKDKFALRKVEEARANIITLDANDVSDTTVVQFMKLCELKEELENG